MALKERVFLGGSHVEGAENVALKGSVFLGGSHVEGAENGALKGARSLGELLLKMCRKMAAQGRCKWLEKTAFFDPVVLQRHATCRLDLLMERFGV